MQGGGAGRAPLAILAPFCTLLAGKRGILKLAPILPHSRTLAALVWWFEAWELPTPKSTQDVRANFTHLQASQARSLGLGVGNSAHSSNLTYPFSKNAFHSPHQFQPQEHLQNQKNISHPMVCSSQETVRWMQGYALRGLFGHICLRKGWPSSGDSLYF